MIWLLPLGLISLGMLACLGLFLSLKSDLHARARRSEDHVEAVLLRLQHETQAVAPATLYEASAEIVTPAPAYIPLRSGMNIGRRTEALRLLRRGEDVSHVAAALTVPRAEIELLVRVQELVAHRTTEVPPAAAQSRAAKTS